MSQSGRLPPMDESQANSPSRPQRDGCERPLKTDCGKRAELYLDDHWKARDAELHERSMPPGIDIEIVQERHHAINWITRYAGLSWDEVTTDT
jgi:hypothetical protein